MDRYEYKLKVEQLEHLLQEKDYETAAEIADTINWRRVKSAATLCMVGEIYDRIKRYEDSREILLMAYDRAAVGRNILYRLTLVALKMGNIEEAKEYYEEFLDVAPHDNQKYVLRYQIAKLEGASLPELIEILEEFKERDFTEEWAFELAYLYHRLRDGERCVEACDELVLWFGDGKYVEKALEMKMLYQPLDQQQEEKYRQFKRQKRCRAQAGKEDRAETEGSIPEEMPEISPSPSRFNTTNLQAELAKSMQQIMEANTQETVSDTMDNIKQMVKEIPYLQVPQAERPGQEEPFGHIETEEEIDQSLNSQFNEYLAEEWDGQYRMHVPEGGAYEPQVAGQMDIEDVLAEWEKIRRAYEAAMENANQRRLESAKARAWQEAQELMSRLNHIMPELEAGASSQELMKEQYLLKEGFYGQEGYSEEPYGQEGYSEESYGDDAYTEGAYQQEEYIEESPERETYFEETDQQSEDEPEQETYPQEEDQQGESEEHGEEPYEKGDASEQDYQQEEDAEEASGQETYMEKMDQQDEGEESWEVPYEKDGSGTSKRVSPEWERASARHQQRVYGPPKPNRSSIIPLEKLIEKQTALEPVVKENKDAEEFLESAFRAAKASREEKYSVPKIAKGSEDRSSAKLNDDLRKIFSYFVPVVGMEQQLCSVLEGVAHRKAENGSSSGGNIVITGGKGSGKTVLATDFIKAIQKTSNLPGGKVGKITGASLNGKDLNQLLKKVAGGYLIIEHAGEMSHETVTRLALLMDQNTEGLLVIMEDTRKEMEKVLSLDANFAKKFTERIKIPVFTSDELVEFAKAYAAEEECEIDDMGILALYNRISNIQKLDEATTLTEVKEIVDEAISSAERGGLKKIFGRKKFSPEGYLYLRERDFDE